jgi:cytochrome c oxidase subunit 2
VERQLKLKGRTACHSLDGGRIVGPSCRGLFGTSETVVNGGNERQVVVDTEYVRKSLSEPTADAVNGYPPVIVLPEPALSDEEPAKVVAFIKELK